MQVSEKDNLNEILISPTWFVEVKIEPAWQSNLVLQYFGNDEKGGFNLYCDIVSLKQRKFKYVSVTFSVWTEIVEILINSKLETISAETPETEWMVLDGNNYYITIQIPDKNLKIERISVEPEIEIKEFINEMLNRCSILQTDRIIDYYLCV
jgi:hypothetical protein